MVRPTTYYFPPIVIVLLLCRFWRLGWQKVLVSLLAFVLPIVVVVGGWQLRNHDAVNSWQVSGSAAVTVYCYNAAAVEAKVTHRSVGVTRAKSWAVSRAGGTTSPPRARPGGGATGRTGSRTVAASTR